MAAITFGFVKNGSTQVVHTYTGSIQTYTVPTGIFALHIECSGAQGGDGQDNMTSPGGIGAFAEGDFAVTPGEIINVIVGERGGDAVSASHGGGGGGGSFVILDNGNVPLIIASGGGGGCYEPGSPGQIGQPTTLAGGGAYVAAIIGQGGNSNNGGGGGYGAGGGGWFSNGVSNNWGTGGGMAGGPGGNSTNPFIDGGFGGGGAGFQGGGGGGGYTGGGGGSWFIGAGGGGSYNTGTNQTNSLAITSGDGLVILTPICFPLSVSPAPAIELCEGGLVTFSANSNSGGTISWDNGVTNNVPFDPPAGTTVFTASSTNPEDCPHSITVVEIPGPSVIANANSTAVCLGITPVILTGSGADNYVWTSGVTDGVAFNPPAGNNIYYVTGTDVNTGCQNTDQIDIFVSDPSTSFTVINEMVGNDGEIDLTVIDGLAPYTFDWDNDGTGDFDDPEDLFFLSGGTYSYVVTDAIGCTISGTVIVDTQLSTSEEEIEFSIYPNPVLDILNIKFNGSFSYELIDITGKIIQSGSGSNNLILNVSDVATGLYTIIISADQIKKTKKIIKQ